MIIDYGGTSQTDCTIAVKVPEMTPSVSDLTLFTVFMLLVTNVVNTDDIIAVIFPRWSAKTVAAM